MPLYCPRVSCEWATLLPPNVGVATGHAVCVKPSVTLNLVGTGGVCECADYCWRYTEEQRRQHSTDAPGPDPGTD